ncbi:MAG: SDR family oxidoreductase [Rhodospirillales bacterium]|jgi:NAD(P)-dependent dehydrogenase (short-subunit alcohol dehydrogenase family)|nr:SDR family oxidoreductase [Rhodospirillales bacterium]
MTLNNQTTRKVLLITGASRGIGAALAKCAGRAEYAVAINYHQSETEAQAVCQSVEREGGVALTIGADVTSEADTIGMFERVALELGPVTHLVNCAGQSADILIEDITRDAIDQMMGLNLHSAIFCCREAVKHMRAHPRKSGGVIVNVSSRAAVLGGLAGRTLYAAAKGGMDSFTIGLAREVGPDNIRVVGVRPGPTKTSTHDGRGGEDRLREIMKGTAAGRPADPEEIAEAILFLLSDQSSFIAGTMIDVSGGR